MRHHALVLGMLFAGCTGSGEPTTPKKMVDYTENNVRESVKTAPETARRAGKRVTKAVNNTEDAITGDGSGDEADEGEGAPEGDESGEGGDDTAEE